MAAQPVRGVIKFIEKLKACTTESEHDYCVRSELVKIRASLPTNGANGYEKKKSLLKLVYINHIGYEVDFGHLEAVSLMASKFFQEMLAGYMGCEVLLADQQDMIPMVINTLKENLQDRNDYIVALALNFIANSFCKEVNENLYDDVVGMLTVTPIESPMTRKKLYMSLLQMLRTSENLFHINDWVPIIEGLLKKEEDVSCLMALTNLLLELVRHVKGKWDGCVKAIIEHILRFLSMSVQGHACLCILHPWLVVKMLRFLAVIEPGKKPPPFIRPLRHILHRITGRMESITHPTFDSYNFVPKDTKDTAKVWTLSMAVTLETTRVVSRWMPFLPNFPVKYILKLIESLLLSRHLSANFVGIELTEIMVTSSTLVRMLKPLTHLFVPLLSCEDPTIQSKVALLLCNICDSNHWQEIIPEIVSLHRSCDVKTQNIILPPLLHLIERYMPQDQLYLDTVFNVALFTHELKPLDEVYRLLHSLPKKHIKLLATKCISILSGASFNDAVLRVCANILGHYGHRVAHETSLASQMHILKTQFAAATSGSKCEIMTTLAKFAARDKSIYHSIERFLGCYTAHSDIMMQTTACELLRIMYLDPGVFHSLMVQEYKMPRKSDNSIRDSASDCNEEEYIYDWDPESHNSSDSASASSEAEAETESASESDSTSESESSDSLESILASSDTEDDTLCDMRVSSSK